MIGLSIARALRKRGVNGISILERSTPGRAASYAAAGMLAPQAEADSPDEFFRFCRASNEMYPDFAAALLEETGVDIEFDEAGTMYLAFTEEDLVELSRRYEWQSGAGLRVEHLAANETHRLEPFVSPDSLGSLYFPDDKQVENRRLLDALVEYARLNAIKIFPYTEVKKVLTAGERIAGVETADGTVFKAGAVVLATGAWTSHIQGAEQFAGLPAIKPIRGQMISFHGAKRLFARVVYSPRGYIVPRRSGRVLAGATSEDVGFDDRVTDAGVETVFENAVEISPSLANLRIEEKWSGLRPYAREGRPFLGAFDGIEGLFVAAGHYRNGILLAPLTAELMAERIVNRNDHEFLRIFGLSGRTRSNTA